MVEGQYHALDDSQGLPLEKDLHRILIRQFQQRPKMPGDGCGIEGGEIIPFHAAEECLDDGRVDAGGMAADAGKQVGCRIHVMHPFYIAGSSAAPAATEYTFKILNFWLDK